LRTKVAQSSNLLHKFRMTSVVDRIIFKRKLSGTGLVKERSWDRS